MKNGIRTLLIGLGLGLLGLGSSLPAGAQGWRLVRSTSGGAVARLEFGAGPVKALEFACLGTHVALGVSPARATPLTAFPMAFQGDRGAPIAYNVPRLGAAAAFGAVLPDARLIDGLTGGWTHARAAAAGAPLEVALTNAPAVLEEALKGCYAIAANHPAETPSTTRADLSGSALPPPLSTDIGDFDSQCRRGDHDGSFGAAVREEGAIRRADFNGDGVQDYLLDGTRMHCSKLPRDNNAIIAAAYTSVPDGSFRQTLAIRFLTSVAIVPGAKPALHVHLAASEDGETDVDETIAMTSATAWGPSKLASPPWRHVVGESLPKEVRSFFSEWEDRCGKAGRTMRIDNYPVDPVITKDDKGRPLDLNGDGKPDYFINAVAVACSSFEAPPPFRGEKACPDLCGVVAVLSAPDGSYALRPMPGTWDMGSGEQYVRVGARTDLCFRETRPDGDTGGTTVGAPEVRYRWSGTTPQRIVISTGPWKNCTA